METPTITAPSPISGIGSVASICRSREQTAPSWAASGMKAGNRGLRSATHGPTPQLDPRSKSSS
ncbi:MAG: hypothetical protein C4584_02715 [Armatimonadetes bacterium]|nr:MAG: hypothetical protein C4584_02715 [Armatimonadota bacterium]